MDIVVVNLLWEEPDKTWTHIGRGDDQPQEKDATKNAAGREPQRKAFQINGDTARAKLAGKPSGDGKASRNVNWLTDDSMLPSLVPGARVLRFGYRLPLPGRDAESRMNVLEIARNLLIKLTGERKDCEDRPVIFIGHAWGGVIIERALTTAFQPPKEYERILNATIGIMFLATPVKGSDNAVTRMAEQIKRSPGDAMFNNARTGSKQLADLLNDFTILVEQMRVPLVSLYEKPSLEPATKRFQGEDSKNYAIDGFTNIPLELDANAMGKFASPTDEAYLVVLNLIADFMGDLAIRVFLEAAEQNMQADVSRMLDGGMKADVRDRKGRTALHSAVRGGHIEMVRLLLGRGGANITVTDNEGMRAIHFAVNKQDLEIVRLLLRKNADIRAKNNKQQSALDLARLEPRNKDSAAILDLLTNRPLVEGPTSVPTELYSRTPEPPPSQEGVNACKAFHATIAEFYFDGEQERRVLEQPSVHELIYGGGPDAILDQAREKDISRRPICRWYHLPANNMAWTEALFAKIGVDYPSQMWAGQVHGSSHPNGRFMRPHAQNIRSWIGKVGQDVTTLFMPYLSYESSSGRLKMSNTIDRELRSDFTRGQIDTLIQNLKKRSQIQRVMRLPVSLIDIPQSRSSFPIYEPWTAEKLINTASSTKSTAVQDTLSLNELQQEFSHGQSILSNPPHLGQEQHLSSYSGLADELLIKAYLNHKPPLHVRRTLDQSFYYMLADTRKRDRDQVVYRYVKRALEGEVETEAAQNQGDDHVGGKARLDPERSKKLQDAKLFMVDQLWLWIIPACGNSKSDIVVSNFPQRWHQATYDPSDLQDLVLNYTGRPPVTSVYDLVTLITTRCIGVFDRSQVSSDLQFLDFFESSIGNAANKETSLFTTFSKISERLNKLDGRRLKGRRARTLDSLFDITKETKLLVEVKDIRDEIEMILSILTDQRSVLNDLASAIKCIDEDIEKKIKITIEARKKFRRVYNRESMPQRRGFEKLLFRERHQMVKTNIDDFRRMDEHAKEIYDALNHLLDLKQKQANAWEARFAREGGEEVAKQGMTILVFTIVTIIFLPLSFLASFFALNVAQYPKDPASGDTTWELGYLSQYLFGVSVAVSVPFILIAFSIDSIKHFWEGHVLRWLDAFWKIIPHPWRGRPSSLGPIAWWFRWRASRERKRREKELAEDQEDEEEEEEEEGEEEDLEDTAAHDLELIEAEFETWKRLVERRSDIDEHFRKVGVQQQQKTTPKLPRWSNLWSKIRGNDEEEASSV